MTGSRRLVVAGAAGFVGTNFLRRVAEDPRWDVRAVYRERRPSVRASNIQHVQADLRAERECRRAMAGADTVVMLAGRMSTTALLDRSPLGPVTENTVLHARALEAAYAAGARKYLWLSSTTGYPKKDGRLKEEDFFEGEPPPPYEANGWMSRYVEKLAALYATKLERKMTVVSLRPTGIFGEHDDFDFETCHALPAIMRRVVERNDPVEIWGTGKDQRDWVYVGDVVEACLLAVDRVEGYEALNIGAGRTYDLNSLLERLLRLDGCRGARVAHVGRKNPATSRSFDCSRAARKIGFKARTPIDDALARTMRWLRESKGAACAR